MVERVEIVDGLGPKGVSGNWAVGRFERSCYRGSGGMLTSFSASALRVSIRSGSKISETMVRLCRLLCPPSSGQRAHGRHRGQVEIACIRQVDDDSSALMCFG